MSFRWNHQHEQGAFWSPDHGCEIIKRRSDKDTLRDPDATPFPDVVQALCRVVLELVERAEAAEDREAAEQARGLQNRVSAALTVQELQTTCGKCQRTTRKASLYCDHCGK